MSANYNDQTTGDEIMTDFGANAKGKHVIVTGSNVGLGFETARLLAKYGAVLTVACRSEVNGTETVRKIKSEFPTADVFFLKLDLGLLASIRSFALAYKTTGRPLDILINNAGVVNTSLTLTADGLETGFGVNHIGHFLLTTELLDVIKRSGTAESPSRIVTVSSVGHMWYIPPCGIRFDDLKGEAHYDAYERYGSSKLANIFFAQELQRRFTAEGSHVISVSLHPGGIQTEITRHMEQEVLQGLLTNPDLKWKTVQQGVSTTLLTALDPSVVPGAYYSDCQVETKEKSHLCGDLEMQTKLWKVSEEIVNNL